MNLECELEWERDLSADGSCAVMCLKVISLSMEESHFDDSAAERYGESGCLYSIRSPRNPETGAVNETCVDVLQKI